MIKIVTDSSSYFKKNEAKLLNVKVIPINFFVNDKTFCESYSDENGEYEQLLRSNASFSTAHPNMSAYLSCFEEELATGNDILCITISSRLSGAYSAAYMAANQTASDKIALFDSQFTAGGLYLLIKEAKKLIDSGMALPDIMKALPQIRDKISIVFSVDDMTPIRKSGRLGFVRLSVGTILNIKPILRCKNGAVVSDSIARGNADIFKKLSGSVPENATEIVVNYIGNHHMAVNLFNFFKEKYSIPVTLQFMGPVLGIHLGLGVIAVSFLK